MPLRMMRSAAPRGRQVAQELRCTAHQKRFKAFVRRVDEKGEAYYTLQKSRERSTAEAKPAEFFDMPNLLLDLDAEGNKNIRALDETDEEALRRKWAVDPKRDAVKSQLKYLEEQLHESRSRAQAILAQPANPWRITAHDILSAALRGAPGKSTTSQEPNRGSEALEIVRLENGIPEYAATEDESFLRWMMLRRRKQEESSQSRSTSSPQKGESPSPASIIEHLEEQISITGIRRLVLRYIASGGDITVFVNDGSSGKSSKAADFPLEIRRAVLNVLDSNERSPTLVLEALAFLGSLEERLQRFNFNLEPNAFHCGAPLYRLGWMLSAEVGDLAAMSKWLDRDYNCGQSSLKGDVEVSQDAFSTLRALRSILQSQQGDESREQSELLQEREQIFSLLTGLRNHVTQDDSIRTMATRLLSDSQVPAQEAVAIYESYITLLGQLGAASTLQAEWQGSASVAEKRLQQASNSSQKGESGDIATVFLPALRGILQVASIPENTRKGASRLDLDIDDCVTNDHAQIGKQSLSAWVGGGEKSLASSSGGGFQPEEVRKVLNLPADKYLDEIRQLQRRSRED